MKATQRIFAASAAFSGWMVLLLVGWIAGGAVHLLLVAALVLFPWSDDIRDETRDSTLRDSASRDQPSSSSQPGGES